MQERSSLVHGALALQNVPFTAQTLVHAGWNARLVDFLHRNYSTLLASSGSRLTMLTLFYYQRKVEVRHYYIMAD